MNDLNFEWDWCWTCMNAFVRCPKCGNNSCNSGSGAFTKDGKKTHWGCDDAFVICDVCDKSYEVQHKAFQCKTVPAKETLKNFSQKHYDAINEYYRLRMEEKDIPPEIQKLYDEKDELYFLKNYLKDE